MIKILCVADTIDPLVYSSCIKERYKDIDIVVSAGDLPMNYLGYIASSLNCPLLFVFGNHNLARYDHFKHQHRHTHQNLEFAKDQNEKSGYIQRTYGATYIGDKTLRTKKILFAGLGGSIYYNNGKNQYTDFQMCVKVAKMLPQLCLNKILYGRYVDILLTHAAPYKINDRDDKCHVGFKAFRWIIEKIKPRYLLHGHIHLYDINAKRITTHMNTKVINVYSHFVLEYNE